MLACLWVEMASIPIHLQYVLFKYLQFVARFYEHLHYLVLIEDNEHILRFKTILYVSRSKDDINCYFLMTCMSY